jgi:hypothetical protein
VNNSIIPEDCYAKVLAKRKCILANILEGLSEERFDYLDNDHYWCKYADYCLNTMNRDNEQALLNLSFEELPR